MSVVTRMKEVTLFSHRSMQRSVWSISNSRELDYCLGNLNKYAVEGLRHSPENTLGRIWKNVAQSPSLIHQLLLQQPAKCSHRHADFSWEIRDNVVWCTLVSQEYFRISSRMQVENVSHFTIIMVP